VKRPEGKLIWFNAVSVGEINAAWSIIKKIHEDSEQTILVTTTTVSATKTVLDKIKKLARPEKVIHQFFPVDVASYVKKFLNHWKPNIFVNVESEVWPNVLTITKKYCPIIILNGKMSRKSFRFWYINKKLREQVFEGIDLCLAQSKKDYKKFINLGLQRVQFLGNIKFFVEKLPMDAEYLKFLKSGADKRKVWLVNCTHGGEEEIITQTHQLLKKKYPDILTINIVRHSQRSGDVENLMRNGGLRVSVASKNDKITAETDVYLYDKLGNLGAFFEFCDIVFMAGSLQPNIGGHTPAECIKFGCCVVTGPFIENNKMLFRDLADNNACIILENNQAETLAKTIGELFDNDDLRHSMINEAYARSVRSNACLGEIVGKILDMVI
jgi:3-deoxy-D-manno-octulosonic-acid transferase